jgi:hypothetical protein
MGAGYGEASSGKARYNSMAPLKASPQNNSLKMLNYGTFLDRTI